MSAEPRTVRTTSRQRSLPQQRGTQASFAPSESRYFNREESWLLFNERVLEEAQDPANPLLERVKFLAITASNLDPLLTPITLDPSHPFPRVLNKSICIALLLRLKRRTGTRPSHTMGILTIPRSLPAMLALPPRKGRHSFLPLEDLIEAQADRMFRGYRIVNRAAFRVTRNSNLYMQEEESRSLLEGVREELHNRRKGDAVRLEIASGADEEITGGLVTNFDLEPWQVFRSESPVNPCSQELTLRPDGSTSEVSGSTTVSSKLAPPKLTNLFAIFLDDPFSSKLTRSL